MILVVLFNNFVKMVTILISYHVFVGIITISMGLP